MVDVTFGTAMVEANASTGMVDAKVAVLRDQAIEALNDEQCADAICRLERAIYLRPSHVELFELRGDAFAELCDFHSAVINYRHALKLARELEARAPEAERSDAHAEVERLRMALSQLLDARAITLLDDGAHEAALLLLDEAVSLAPTSPSFVLHRSLAHTCLERHADALRDLDRHKLLEPPTVHVLYLRAKLHLLAKELSSARVAVEEALALDADHAPSLELIETMSVCAGM